MTPEERLAFAGICQHVQSALEVNFEGKGVTGHLLFPGEDSYIVEVSCGVYLVAIVIPEDVLKDGLIEATVCLDDRYLLNKKFESWDVVAASEACWTALHDHYKELGAFLFGT